MSTTTGAVCDVVVSVRIDEPTLKALKVRARADDRPLSAYLRHELKAIVAREEARTDAD